VQVLDVLIALLKPKQSNDRMNGQEGMQQQQSQGELDSSIKEAAVQVTL
jgi:hypothetical protein